jgi:hypothetical protein
VPLSEDDVEADFEDASAELSLRNFAIDDYGDVGNALSGGTEIAHAMLSVHIRWSGLTKSVRFSNAGLPTPFAGRELQAVNGGASMRWSAAENGSTLSGHLNTADFAMLSQERNGVFFGDN